MEFILDRKATELNSSIIGLNILLAQRCCIIKYLWSSMQVFLHLVKFLHVKSVLIHFPMYE